MNCMRLFRSIHHHQPYKFHISIAKYAMQHPTKFLEMQDKWREKDGLSKRWQLIYKAPMEQWLNYATTYLTFSTTTVAFGSLYYAAFIFDRTTMNDPILLGGDVVLANNAMECFVYLGAFMVFHLAVKVLLSKYVIRLYQDGDNYLAVFRGNFYNSIKTHQFHLKDFKKLNPTFVVSWGKARFGLGTKHAIILENYFKTPGHFNYLLNKRSANNPNDDE